VLAAVTRGDDMNDEMCQIVELLTQQIGLSFVSVKFFCFVCVGLI